MYENNDGICTFNSETLNFNADDAYIIISKAGITVTEYDNDNSVIINDEGIFVDNDNESVRITNSEIHVEGDEPVHLDGILGFIVGSFVKSVTKVALSSIGRTPNQTFKYIVNNENKNDSTNFYNIKI